MDKEQVKHFSQINQMLENASTEAEKYWYQFTNINTWQFWVLLALLIVPLLVLYFTIDRKKAMLIGFYGFNVHAWFHYTDLYTTTHGYTNFPYKIIPFLPVSLSLDTSLVPVTYMLLYQWTINHKKNYYLFAILLSGVFALAFKPLLAALDLFEMYKGMNYFYIFLLYMIIAVVSKLITNVFIYLQSKAE